MCRIKKRKNKSSQFPPETGNIASSMNAQSNPKESTNAQANEQKIASSCDDQTKKTPGNHTIAISDAIEVKQQEQQTGEAHAVKRMEKLPEASPPEVKVPSGERKQKPSKRTAAFSEETAKKDELRTCSTQTPHTEGSMLLSKKQTVLDDATVTREMKPTDSRVTYELSTDDTLAGVPNVMPYFEDERIRFCVASWRRAAGNSKEMKHGSQDVTASSLLGALTSNSATNYLSLPYNNDLLFSIVVDNNRKLHGEIVDDLPGAIRFPCETIALIVYPQMDQMGNPVVLLFGEACDPLTEWYCTAQLRIKCGPEDRSKGVQVVDRGVFHFGKRAHPISIQIRDSRVKRIKFELRFVTKVYESLPRFESGDITIKFKFGDTMQADKSLLALHSSYMATKLKDASPDAVVELGDFEREAFIELLYQIYDTIRPISANFILLSKAAVAYRAERILERITSYLLSLDVDLEQKLRAAVELELDDALGEIVFRAEQRGEWTQIISKGFEPSSLGREVYRQIVCPAIIEAKVRRYGYPFKKCENIIELGKSNPPYTVPMKLVDKTLHINRGIIELHNTKGFIMRNSNEIELRQSAELGVLCIRAGITVADLIELMFRHIYPQRDLVPAHCLRPMMLLAHNNGMCKLLDSLGNALSLEPPITTEMMLEHFELADRYEHSNLLQASLLRIEGSFRGKASRLVTLPRFKNLAEEIKMQILDRHCSGWALFDKCLAGRPTKRIRRVLTLGSGGPLESECDSETSLQYTEESLSVEAFGAPQDVIIN